MKYYILLFLFAILSCNKNASYLSNSSVERANSGSENIVPIEGPASALINGVEWHGNRVYCQFDKSGCYPGKLNLSIEKVAFGGYWGIFNFTKIIPDTFPQKMYAPYHSCFGDSIEAYFDSINEDVILGTYVARNSADNFLKLNNYNSVTGDISGSFAGTFILASGSGLPKKLHVTNGRFYGKVSN